MALTKQTPPSVKAWLAGYRSPFEDSWTLDKVADDCHTGFLAGSLSPGLTAQLVTDWAAHKLAICSDFTGDHWGWIADLDQFERVDGRWRLSIILGPVFAAATHSWRFSPSKRLSQLKDIEKLAKDLLPLIRESSFLDVDLSRVAAKNAPMQPLARYSRLLTKRASDESRRLARLQVAGGGTISDAASAAISSLIDGYREPRISDFLRVLIAVASNEPQPTAKTGYRAVDDFVEGLDEADQEILAERFGLDFRARRAIDELKPGGEFGKYPNRKDALRRAVIFAFPEALSDRLTEAPAVTPASVIERACFAWFGSAPAIPDINAAIKPFRRDLDRWMPARIPRRRKGVEALGREDGTATP